MNEIQKEMLKNAGLLHDVADELVRQTEAGDYHRVSEVAMCTKEMMYELARMAVVADMRRED